MTWGPHPLRWLESLGLALAALGWTVWHIGWPALNPLETRWMHDGDWELTYNAWLLFIRGPWTLQLGASPALLYPYGIPIFYNAVVLWVGLLGKLVAPFVAAEFQLYGLWLVACFVGQAFAYRWALEKAGVEGPARVLGALLGLVDPVLESRFGHLALMGHGLLAVQVGCALWAARKPGDSLRAAQVSVGWAVFTVGVDGYLAAQAIPLSVAVLLIAGRGAWGRVGALLGVLTFGVATMLWVTGALPATVDPGAEGFGQFSSDMLSLFNSQGGSRFGPSFPINPRQGEGYGYLGVGGLALLVAAAVVGALQWRQVGGVLRRVWPLLAVAAALLVYSWSSVVTFGGRVVLVLTQQYAPFQSLTNAFRTSGRFVWPMHTVVLLSALALVARSPWPRLVRLTVVLAALALQLFERKQLPRAALPSGPMPELNAAWTGAGTAYRHIAIIPPQVQWVCPYDAAVVGKLTRLAAREGLTINSGHVGRVPYGFASQCAATFTGPLDSDTLYIVDPRHLEDPGFATAACGTFDGLMLCVDAQRVRDGRPF